MLESYIFQWNILVYSLGSTRKAQSTGWAFSIDLDLTSCFPFKSNNLDFCYNFVNCNFEQRQSPYIQITPGHENKQRCGGKTRSRHNRGSRWRYVSGFKFLLLWANEKCPISNGYKTAWTPTDCLDVVVLCKHPSIPPVGYRTLIVKPVTQDPREGSSSGYGWRTPSPVMEVTAIVFNRQSRADDKG